MMNMKPGRDSNQFAGMRMGDGTLSAALMSSACSSNQSTASRHSTGHGLYGALLSLLCY